MKFYFNVKMAYPIPTFFNLAKMYHAGYFCSTDGHMKANSLLKFGEMVLFRCWEFSIFKRKR